jgi:plastocyanin domain-containing protein
MEIKKSTLQNISIGFLVLVVALGLIAFLIGGDKSNPESANTDAVSISGDEQIIDLTAKGGYSPRIIEAKANTKTILRVSTNNTFDCSSALKIPELGISKNLPATGKTDIEIAAQEPGSEIDGTCSMGMYDFKITFV